MPKIIVTTVFTIPNLRGHSDTISGTDTVKLRQSERMTGLYEKIFDGFTEQLSVLQLGVKSAEAEEVDFVDVASSFLPHNTRLTDGTKPERNN